MNPPRIQLFLKAPRPGTVKTRIGATVGPERAAAIYRELVESQLARLPEGWPVEIHYAPADAESELHDWLGPDHVYFPQCEGDLGDRLSHAVRHAFQNGASSVCCIGGDCPGLDPSHFQSAQEALDSGTDLVFGPAEDGGYVLLAQKTHIPELFTEIPWSSPHTLAASLEKARALHLQVHLLPPLYDIDTEEDWRVWKQG